MTVQTKQEPPQVTPADLEVPAELSRRRLRSRLLIAGALVLAVVALITLVPGLGSLRARFDHANAGWLVLGGVLKLLSALCYVIVFRAVFCRRMSWRLSYQIGMSELGANALFPTGGAGGLALGAWALRRGGMAGEHIARRTVAFFLLTSLANVGALFLIGVGLAIGLLPGRASVALTLGPAAVAALAVLGALLAGRLAARLHDRLARRGREPSRVVRGLDAVSRGVEESLILLRQRDPRLIVGVVGYLAFDIMVLWATFHAFGATPNLAIIWIAYLIGELGGLLPIPGGLGGVDAGLVGALALYGTPLATATAAVLAYRAIALWIPAVVGAGAFVQLRRALRGEAHEIATCAPGEQLEVVGRGPVVVDKAAPVGG